MNAPDPQELYAHALDFCKILIAHGFDAQFKDGSLDGYKCKVSIGRSGARLGDLVLYHKPSKQTFTCATNELKDKSVVPVIADLYRRFLTGELSMGSEIATLGWSPDFFAAADYYRQIFYYYASEAFDFGVYASALADIATRLDLEAAIVTEQRFDYFQLTALHDELRTIAGRKEHL